MNPSDSPALTGAYNFRSLAGVPTLDGRRIKPHTLMRSAPLDRLTDEDWQQFHDLGLRTICDLRGLEEVADAPTAVPSQLAVRTLQFDIRNDVRSDFSLAESLRLDPTPAGAHRLMLNIYGRFAQAMAPRLKQLFDLLVDSDDGAPLLVHCTAGKDRTGFLVSLILHALGVAPDVAMTDYLSIPASQGIGDPRIPHLQRYFRDTAKLDLTPEVLVPVLSVDREYLSAAWQILQHDHGGADEYLQRHAGLDVSRRERLRERMLT